MRIEERLKQAEKAVEDFKRQLKLEASIFTIKNMEGIARHAGFGEESRKNLLSQMSDYYDDWLERDEDVELCETCGEPLEIEDENVGFDAPQPVKIIFRAVCRRCVTVL